MLATRGGLFDAAEPHRNWRTKGNQDAESPSCVRLKTKLGTFVASGV